MTLDELVIGEIVGYRAEPKGKPVRVVVMEFSYALVVIRVADSPWYDVRSVSPKKLERLPR